MKTNDLKKGDRIRLSNGWYATIMDNKKGNIRFCEVEGLFTELGSVYSHDIEEAYVGGRWVDVEHTPAQLQLREAVNGTF